MDRGERRGRQRAAERAEGGERDGLVRVVERRGEGAEHLAHLELQLRARAARLAQPAQAEERVQPHRGRLVVEPAEQHVHDVPRQRGVAPRRRHELRDGRREALALQRVARGHVRVEPLEDRPHATRVVRPVAQQRA